MTSAVQTEQQAGSKAGLQGSWAWALALGALSALLSAGSLMAAAPLLKLEPLLGGGVTALLGGLTASLAVLGLRSYRANPKDWNQPHHWGGLLLWVWFLEMLLLITLHYGHYTLPWPLGVALGLSSVMGLALSYFPYSLSPPEPGEALAQALQKRVAEAQTRNQDCSWPGCEHLGLACPGVQVPCHRVYCGSHWIQENGRCYHCGFRFAPPPQVPRPGAVLTQPLIWGGLLVYALAFALGFWLLAGGLG